jgi:ribosomal protein S4
MAKIILMKDVYETKRRKEKELEYYQEQLELLQEKMFFVKKEIDMTNFIIHIIENEKEVDIKKLITEKSLEKSDT